MRGHLFDVVVREGSGRVVRSGREIFCIKVGKVGIRV